jgi:hypothetical protein
MAQQWEYKAAYANNNAASVVQIANREGADGWELAYVFQDSQNATLVLKRPVAP